MSDTVIRVEGLGKKYTIGRERNGSDGLRHRLNDFLTAPLRRLRGLSSDVRPLTSDFWALKDVSFEVKQGEVVGIIGRNGAGKSTLLKILSRITEPTEGRVRIRGRVASLLEVGTGFHPELTGRENVFLNGAILGMSRVEIKRKFDEIVAFAEVEKFLDTPVKRYSSGMYVRLAFAVAAHLEPEILIVDEVLAVGDAQFQKKCLGKMGEVSREGRTVLFVSHNMTAVENLCESTVLLEDGRITLKGVTQPVISSYLESVQRRLEGVSLLNRADRSGSGRVRLAGFHLEDVDGNRIPTARSGKDVFFALSYIAQENARNVDVGISLHDNSDRMLTVLYSGYLNQTFDSIPRTGVFRCLITSLPLASGRYKVGARIVEDGVEADWPRDGIGFIDVDPGDFYGTGKKGFDGAAVFLIKGGWSYSEGHGPKIAQSCYAK
jgi:homopolymeric O-antigen transport system ATP-binding protein